MMLALHSARSRQTTVESANPFIPQVIHFIWLGPYPLPHQTVTNADEDCCNTAMKSWRVHHPDWSFHVWRENDLESLDCCYNRRALQYALENKLYGMASDIARLEILYQHGGLYVDVDYLCIASVDDLHDKFDFYCGASNTGCIEINNGILASHAGYPLLRVMMDSIAVWYRQWEQHCREQQSILSVMSGFLDGESAASLLQATRSATRLSHEDMIVNTGPGLLTRTLGQYLTSATKKDDGETGERIGVLPYHIFHPVANTLRHNLTKEVIQAHVVPGQTKAVHLWSCSWQRLNSRIYS
jgi:hypothetical protein